MHGHWIPAVNTGIEFIEGILFLTDTATTTKLEASNLLSTGHTATRRSSANATDVSTSIGSNADVRTTRSAACRSSACASTDVSPTPPSKRCKLGSTASVASSLRTQLRDQNEPRQQQQNYSQPPGELNHLMKGCPCVSHALGEKRVASLGSCLPVSSGR